jgi:hypothetical protein
MEARFSEWLERHDAKLERFFRICNAAAVIAAALFFVVAVYRP